MSSNVCGGTASLCFGVGSWVRFELVRVWPIFASIRDTSKRYATECPESFPLTKRSRWDWVKILSARTGQPVTVTTQVLKRAIMVISRRAFAGVRGFMAIAQSMVNCCTCGQMAVGGFGE